jgi:hypothetical protein
MSISVRGADDLSAAVTSPHDHVREALEDPWRGRSAAVAWCSAHLAASDRVLYPAALRHDPRLRGPVRAARAVDHRLQQVLCRLDRQLMGDAKLDHVPVPELAEQVRQALGDHTEAEGGLLTQLQELLTPEEQQVLADRMAEVQAHAPTRPHPHTRHTALAPVIGWLDALVDRARDVMDNRVDPTGRPGREVIPPGRWGCYVMGVPYPEEPTRRAS